jgi:hypothetical protein
MDRVKSKRRDRVVVDQCNERGVRGRERWNKCERKERVGRSGVVDLLLFVYIKKEGKETLKERRAREREVLTGRER